MPANNTEFADLNPDFNFDTGDLAEVREMIRQLGGRKLPVHPETWVTDGYDDAGNKNRTIYRKCSETGFYARVFPR